MVTHGGHHAAIRWNLPRPGIELGSLYCQVDSSALNHQGSLLSFCFEMYGSLFLSLSLNFATYLVHQLITFPIPLLCVYLTRPVAYPELILLPTSSSQCGIYHSVMSDSLQPDGLYSPWNSPGQNPGVGRLSCFQGIFPTQGSNPGLPHCRRILYQLSHKGSPKNTGRGSLPLLQRIFPTQELNRGLPHCRRILHQLSYQGSRSS